MRAYLEGSGRAPLPGMRYANLTHARQPKRLAVALLAVLWAARHDRNILSAGWGEGVEFADIVAAGCPTLSEGGGLTGVTGGSPTSGSLRRDSDRRGRLRRAEHMARSGLLG